MAIKVRRSKEPGEGPDDEGEEEQQQTGEPAEGDPFLRSSAQTLSWFAENRNLVVGGFIATIVAVIGVYVGYNYLQQQSVQASSAASQAITSYQMPVQGSPAVNRITSDSNIQDLPTTFDSRSAKWKEMFKEASEAVDKYPDAKVTKQAHLMRAAAALQLEKYAEAVKSYKAYLEGSATKDEKVFAYYGLAVAQGAQQKVDAAVSSIDKMVEAGGDLEAFGQYQKGIFYEEAGKTDKAREMYNKVLETDSKFPYKIDINRRLALL